MWMHIFRMFPYTEYLSSLCRMHMATQHFTFPARMVTIRCVCVQPVFDRMQYARSGNEASVCVCKSYHLITNCTYSSITSFRTLIYTLSNCTESINELHVELQSNRESKCPVMHTIEAIPAHTSNWTRLL